jgi:hypothetical protein
MRGFIFWAALYAGCTILALLATPGVPEAMGFALPPFLAAVAVAWLARSQTPRARHLMATTAAAALLLGAITGLYAQQSGVQLQRAFQVQDLRAA